MRDPADAVSGDLFQKRGRGRPRKADAMTPAERAKAYRDRKAGLSVVRPAPAKPVVVVAPAKPAAGVSERQARREAEDAVSQAWFTLAAAEGALARSVALDLEVRLVGALHALVGAEVDPVVVAQLEGSLFRFRRCAGL